MGKENVIVDVWGQQLEVSGHYHAGHPGVRYHTDGSGTPPDPAELEIDEVIWIMKLDKEGDHNVAVDVSDLIFAINESSRKSEVYEEIEEAAIDEIENKDHDDF